MTRPGRIPFDPGNCGLETVRRIVFARLQSEAGWTHLDMTGEGFAPYVEYVNNPAWTDGRPKLLLLAQEIYWQLLCEGILAPGCDSSNLQLPFFHITDYGRKVLGSSGPQPYDPSGYLAHVRARIPTADSTVMAYLAESLETFRKGNLVASTVMLGIAAERVFLLLCESLEAALANPREKAELSKRLGAFAMKPKLDWVQAKIQELQKQRLPSFPDNATMMTVVVYDLIRCQRNELGHPRELPPCITRADAFCNMQIFPRYFELAEQVRRYLTPNPV